MALSAKLELRQGQQLVMTPQLQQAIRLLQLSNMELAQFVEPRSSATRCSKRTKATRRRCAWKPPRRRNYQAGGAAPASETDCVDLDRPVADAEGTFDTEYDNVFPDSRASDHADGQDASGWASLRQRTSHRRRHQHRSLPRQRRRCASI